MIQSHKQRTAVDCHSLRTIKRIRSVSRLRSRYQNHPPNRWSLAGEISSSFNSRTLPLCALAVLLFCSCHNRAHHKTEAHTFGDLTISGISVHFGYSAAVLPYTNEEMRPQVSQVSPAAVGWLTEQIGLYPPGFLHKHIKDIYLFGRIQVWGFDYGATYDRSGKIYQAFDAELNQSQTSANFHAEISSVLYHKFHNLVSKVGLKYEDRPFTEQDVHRTNFSTEPDATLAAKGYLNHYAMSSAEEDFNSIAGALFSGDDTAWTFAKTYSAFRTKFRKVTEFYGLIDSRFTPGFFPRLHRW